MLQWLSKMQGKWRCSHTKIESPLNAVDAEETVGNVTMTVDQENQGKQTLLNKPQRHHLKLKKSAKKIPLRSQQNESCTSCHVDGLGYKGDIVSISDGYAQNKLIPQGLAFKATAGAEKEAEKMRQSRESVSYTHLTLPTI